MDVIRNVTDIAQADRTALEHLLGQSLSDNQQVVLRIVNREGKEAVQAAGDFPESNDATLPAWCNVLEGLSDAELAEFATSLQTPVRLAHPAE